MPQTDDDDLTPAEEVAAAKHKLLSAAGAIHPLQSARESLGAKPFVLVGTAALTGAVLGASTGAIGGWAKMVGSVLNFARPLAVTAIRFAISRAAHFHEAAAAHDAEEAEKHAAVAAAHAAVASGTARPNVPS